MSWGLPYIFNLFHVDLLNRLPYMTSCVIVSPVNEQCQVFLSFWLNRKWHWITSIFFHCFNPKQARPPEEKTDSWFLWVSFPSSFPDPGLYLDEWMTRLMERTFASQCLLWIPDLGLVEFSLVSSSLCRVSQSVYYFLEKSIEQTVSFCFIVISHSICSEFSSSLFLRMLSLHSSSQISPHIKLPPLEFEI